MRIGNLFLLAAAVWLTPAVAEVRVWQDTLTLPTYREGPPGRHGLTCTRAPIRSAGSRCSMRIPPSRRRKSATAGRGPRSASSSTFRSRTTGSPCHRSISLSPRTMTGARRCSSGIFDRPYGMEWTVELRLRPGSTVLEEHVALYNRSDVRHRFHWWNNSGVRVWDDSKICYPMRWTASHGFTDVDTWPVNSPWIRASSAIRRRGPSRGSCTAAASRSWACIIRTPTRALPITPTTATCPGRKSGPGAWMPTAGLAPRALGRQQRLRGGPGGADAQPGDLRVSGAARDHPLHRVLDARPGHRRDRARQSRGRSEPAPGGRKTDSFP